jgi:hypothetical protein
LDGYIIPVSIRDGVTRLKIRPYTDHEFETLPHVTLTSELEWDPSVIDHEFKEDESWGDPPTIPSSVDEVGDFKQRVSLKHQSYFAHPDGYCHDDVIDQCIFATYTTPSVYEYDNTICYDACEEFLIAPT